jgi:hypothetical protein
MEKRLEEVLAGKGENYILPFFWQHGENRELLREGMKRIRESGIRAVCVESRPHPDFLGESWWRDMDIVLECAQELGMKVWVLDDAHFPTGYCNGQIRADSPYGKTYLTHYCIDTVGPANGCGYMIRLEEEERLIGVTIGQRDRTDPFHMTQVRSLMPCVKDDLVYVDIPEGIWCVTVIKTTKNGTGRKQYINTIDKNSVRFFLETVYEPHYLHYREKFGTVFAGFFSDEPEIGNCLGEYGHDAHIGQPDMNLPWCDEAEQILRERWGGAFDVNLLSLWVDTDENRKQKNHTGRIRYEFMDIISDLYGRNFCMQIGDWCRVHQVEYIGHVIEDNGSHARLGLGTGHYFRALHGQDMAGIDVVLQQIRPQLDDLLFYNIGGNGFYNGEFFHYGLAKLGASLGHLDPKKKGRIMCEIFGAYGWAEGLKLMKWLIDHMLVNGVNWFVPHAFTMKEFPDPDCPPHFYARGKNPQFPYFRYLMEYCNRVSHLIQGGFHVPCVALLYSAEQEWMGEYRPFEKDAKELTRGQVDFEVVPCNLLASIECKDGRLSVGEENMDALVVSGSSYLPAETAEHLERFDKAGIPVLFTKQKPMVLGADGCVTALPEMKSALSVNEEELVQTLHRMNIWDIRASQDQPWLRYYHYQQSDGEFYLFFQESVTDTIETEIAFAVQKQKTFLWYDPWINQMEPCSLTENGTVALHLAPYEMKILYIGEAELEPEKESRRQQKDETGQKIELNALSWTLETKEVGADKFTKEERTPALGNLTGKGGNPYFSGTMRYRISFEGKVEKHVQLDLGEVYESAHVTVNGKDAGVRIAPPYRFSLDGMLKDGNNVLEVIVTNTLVHRQRDFFSMTMPVEPSGLIGPAFITYLPD